MTFEIDSNNIQNEDVQLTTDANGDLIIEHIPTGATFVYDQANDNWKPSGGLDIGGNDITNAGAVNADSADITNNLLAGQVGTSSEPVDVAAASVSADSVDAGSVNTDGIQVNNEYLYAADDSALTDRLATIKSGGTIILGRSDFTTDRTISKMIQFICTGSGGNGSRILGNWTFDDRGMIHFGGRHDGDITFNSPNSIISNAQFSNTSAITVSADRTIINGVMGGEVTFETGASGCIVDSCSNTTVTDNDGGNTIGDIA